MVYAQLLKLKNISAVIMPNVLEKPYCSFIIYLMLVA